MTTKKAIAQSLSDGQAVYRARTIDPETGIVAGVVRLSAKKIIIDARNHQREMLDPAAPYLLCAWRPTRKEAAEWAAADLIRDAERLEGGASGKRKLAAEWAILAAKEV